MNRYPNKSKGIARPKGAVRTLPGGAGYPWRIVRLSKFRTESFAP